MNSAKLRDTSIPATFSAKINSAQLRALDAQKNTGIVSVSTTLNPQSYLNAADYFSLFIQTIAVTMSYPQFKTKSDSALVFSRQDTGEMVMACIATYKEEENSYDYVFSFNQEDISTISKSNVINYSDFIGKDQFTFYLIFEQLMRREYHSAISFVDTDGSDPKNTIIMIMIDVIQNYLSFNASDSDTVELIIDGLTGSFDSGRTEEQYFKDLTPLASFTVEILTAKCNKIKAISGKFLEETLAIAKGNSDSEE